MAKMIDVNELQRKQQDDKIERGVNLTRLARTHLENSQRQQAWRTCEDAEEILNQYPGNAYLSKLLTLKGVIADKLSMDAEHYFIKAKSESAPPFKDKIQKTSSAEASKHYGVWLSSKGRSLEARRLPGIPLKVSDPRCS